MLKNSAFYARQRRREPKEREVGLRDDNRRVERFLLTQGDVTFDLTLVPDPRDVRRWKVYRDDVLFVHGGLEQMWRAVQRELAPPLGRRHWQG